MAAQEELSRTGGSVTKRSTAVAEEQTTSFDLTPTAAAAEAKAEVEARFAFAAYKPRNMERFTKLLYGACDDLAFADVALYSRPVGRKQNEKGEWEDEVHTDLSIRFMETALQFYGNVYIASRIISENDQHVQVAVSVLDCESNLTYSNGMLVPKVVERRNAPRDRVVRGRRFTSSNREVYLLEATDAELRNSIGAEKSKLMRDNSRRLIPRYILDEARRRIDATLTKAQNEPSWRERIVAKFAGVGVTEQQLTDFAGDLDKLTAEQIKRLGRILNAIVDGETTWADVTQNQESEPVKEPASKPSARNRVMEQQSFEPPHE